MLFRSAKVFQFSEFYKISHTWPLCTIFLSEDLLLSGSSDAGILKIRKNHSRVLKQFENIPDVANEVSHERAKNDKRTPCGIIVF